MNRYSEAGKGSKQRPGSGFSEGWERIWGKKGDGPFCVFCDRTLTQTEIEYYETACEKCEGENLSKLPGE